MTSKNLEKSIETAYEMRESISSATKGPVRDAIELALEGLGSGLYRVAEPNGSGWVVHQWLKKAVLLSFRLLICNQFLGLLAAPFGMTKCHLSYPIGMRRALPRLVSGQYPAA